MFSNGNEEFHQDALHSMVTEHQDALHSISLEATQWDCHLMLFSLGRKDLALNGDWRILSFMTPGRDLTLQSPVDQCV